MGKERFVIICVQPTPRLRIVGDRSVGDRLVDVRSGDAIKIGACFWTDGECREVTLQRGKGRFRAFALFLNREDSGPFAYILTATYARCFVTKAD